MPGQRQYALMNRINDPLLLREEPLFHFRRRRDPVPRAYHRHWPVQIIEGQLANVGSHRVQVRPALRRI